MDGIGHISLDGVTLRLFYAQGRADAMNKKSCLDGWEEVRQACGIPPGATPAQTEYERGFTSWRLRRLTLDDLRDRRASR